MKRLIKCLFSIFIFTSFITLAQADPLHTAKTTLDDSAVTISIKSKYTADPLLNPFKVGVKTVNHVVYLSGTVDTSIQREKAVNIAKSVDGVKQVDIKGLVVKASEDPVKDKLLTQQVVSALSEQYRKAPNAKNNLTVETKNGVVYLSGTASSDEQAKTLINAVKALPQVSSVRSDIQVD